MSSFKFYNFSQNSDFLKAEILSRRYKQVLDLHYQGFLQKEIGRKLRLKERTVWQYFSNLQVIYESWAISEKKVEKVKKITTDTIKSIDFV